MVIQVQNPVKEHEGSKDMYISYAVRTQVGKNVIRKLVWRTERSGQTNLKTFDTNPMVVRRRFQDFVFLRDYLVKSFPACVVPPIPDKHRLGRSDNH